MARTRPNSLTAPLPAFAPPLTAAARPILPNRKLVIGSSSSQQAAWNFWRSEGELAYAVSWLANMISRVRLVIAEVSDTDAEPVLVETGPAVDVLNRLAGGVGGQSQLLKEFSTHLSVPGEGWLVGEQPDDAIPNGPEFERWMVLSAEEIRPARRKIRGEAVFEIREGEGENQANDAMFWRPISPDSLVVRFWRPDAQYGWRADSPTMHALGALTELDLANKRILANLMSRLVGNGILLYDKGRLSIPDQGPAAEGAEAVDNFAKLLVDVASQAIADPMSPAAGIPIPIGWSADNMEGFDPKLLMQVIKFGDATDEKLIAQRESAIKRVATSMNTPQEVMLGMKGLNDWSVAQIEEGAVKTNVSPDVELICHSLTTGFLYPMLRGLNADLTGPTGGRLVVWYDPTAITVRPDRSKNALDAYDRFELNGASLRTEAGFGDEDAPNPAELNEMLLKRIVRDNPALAAAAVEQLGGPVLSVPVAPSTNVTINRPQRGVPTDVPSDAQPDPDVVESPGTEGKNPIQRTPSGT